MKISKPLALMAAVAVAGFLSLGGAKAANVATGSAPLPAIQKAQETNIQPASHRKRYWRGHRNRYWGGGRRYWGPGAGLWLGFGLSPYYYGGGPYYYRPYRPLYAPVGSAHVRWCLNRYRSYDPRSNSFMGYDGYRHRCRSPYRY
jgi:hypothetical protein